MLIHIGNEMEPFHRDDDEAFLADIIGTGTHDYEEDAAEDDGESSRRSVRRAGANDSMTSRLGGRSDTRRHRWFVWRNHPKLLGPGALIFVAKQL